MKTLPGSFLKSRIACIGVALLVTCALCSSAVAGPKKQLVKQLKIRGTIFADITAVYPTNGPTAAPTIGFKITDVDGMMTHAGTYALEAEGYLNLATGEGFDTGTFFAANRDEIFFDGHIYMDTMTMTPKLLVTSLEPPGTGRFDKGSGWFLADLFDLQLDFDTMKLSFKFQGQGDWTF